MLLLAEIEDRPPGQCGAPSNRILSGEELLIHRIHYEGGE